MTVFFSQQEAGLAVASLVSLAVLCVMCLSCRKRPRIIREGNIVYGHELVRGGRKFTVLRSKTVRLNEKLKDQPPTTRESSGVNCATIADQPNYQNVPKLDSGEFDYVDPIPSLVYQNIIMANKKKDEDSYSYQNVFRTVAHPAEEDSDSSDGYANTRFLMEMEVQEDEPDYVNTEEEMKT